MREKWRYQANIETSYIKTNVTDHIHIHKHDVIMITSHSQRKLGIKNVTNNEGMG